MERSEPVAPRATYRLQLRAEFGFRAAAAVVPYLARLGVSHLYLSPILQAARGSSHGYDVVDHARLSDELGGDKGFAELVSAVRAHDLALLVDIVPNHMHIGAGDNAWWWDVLENGPSARRANCFDIDWRPPEEKNHNTILLPVLGDHRAALLARGEIQVVRALGGFVILAPGQRAPVAPRSIATLLDLVELPGATPAEVRDHLFYLRDAWAGLPMPTSTDAASRRRRHRDKVVLARLTDRFLADHPEVARCLDEALVGLGKDADRLDAFLDSQNHRLAYWRTAAEELGYRRFFDVNQLVGLRAEDPEVFADTHRRIAELVSEGSIAGLRVDHVDGLADPDEYLYRLRQMAPAAWIVVEKILGPDEELPAWPIDGTTGYEFGDDVLRLFVDEPGRAAIVAAHAAAVNDARSFAERSREYRLKVLREVLRSDVERLTEALVSCCASERRFRDVTRGDLRQALVATLASLPVYRTYLRAGKPASARDRELVAGAIGAAQSAEPELEPTVFAALEWALYGGCPRFVVRFQQLSGAAMAKGVEDTTFYAVSGFVALNEVGGEPGHGTADAVERFHARNAAAAPRRMLATSTHDSKRAEDVRARLAVLSQRADGWIATLARWQEQNADKRGAGPDADLERLFYQVLVGAWPLEKARALAYLEKASREAKTHTSWTRQDQAFEASTRAFVEACYDDQSFMAEVQTFVDGLVGAGRVVSLAQLTLKLGAPGVPDLYQGSELEALDLVDPDNRRPVDYPAREQLLAELPGAAEAWRRASEGVAKLFVVERLLGLRKRRPELFAGDYRAIDAGPAHLAFARGEELVVVVPIRVESGQDVRVSLPPGPFVDIFTGAKHRDSTPLSLLFREFPVAVLERIGEEGQP